MASFSSNSQAPNIIKCKGGWLFYVARNKLWKLYEHKNEEKLAKFTGFRKLVMHTENRPFGSIKYVP